MVPQQDPALIQLALGEVREADGQPQRHLAPLLLGQERKRLQENEIDGQRSGPRRWLDPVAEGAVQEEEGWLDQDRAEAVLK